MEATFGFVFLFSDFFRVCRFHFLTLGAWTNGLDACFKQLWVEIVALTYSTICKQRSRSFPANRSILANHQFSVKDCLTFFHAVVTPVACFAAGHRTIFKQELAALDVAHRKPLRQPVSTFGGLGNGCGGCLQLGSVNA